jgi:fermentation-respiration switch protein FrsA (DUF1100 family)
MSILRMRFVITISVRITQRKAVQDTPVGSCCSLPQPFLRLNGTADANIPLAEARRLYAAARDPKSVIEVKGAGHLSAWEGGATEPALKAVVAWTAPDPPPASMQ